MENRLKKPLFIFELPLTKQNFVPENNFKLSLKNVLKTWFLSIVYENIVKQPLSFSSWIYGHSHVFNLFGLKVEISFQG